MNYKGILFFLGIYSLFVSFFAFLNILYSIYFNFIIDINSYLLTFLISLIIGSIFCYIGKNHHKNITLSEQIIFITLSFFYIPFLICIPFFLSIYDFNFLDSYFESVSGVTTTGFSVIQNIENIDDPLVLWRSSSQWLGGLFLLIAIIGTLGTKQIKIKPAYLVFGSALGRNFYNNFNFNFFRILLIYSFSTIFIFFLYGLADIRLLDSLNIAFTTISSGGFIPSDNLNKIFKTDVQIFLLSFTLLFPIFNFYLLFNIFTKQFLFKNHQEDVHLFILILLLTLIFYFFLIPNDDLSNVFFAVASSVSTSGIFNYSSNFDLSLFFILLTVIGGSLISTSSGFKYVRFYILFKISYQEIYRLVKPINIFNKNLFNTEVKIEDEDSKIAFLIFVLFIISLFILSSILTLDNLDFENAFKLSFLTLTNTSASSLYGINNLNFFDLNFFSKMSLIVFMILGKVELVAILYLFKKFIFKE